MIINQKQFYMTYNINHKKNKGFTLVEILVAISILAVIILAINRIYFSIMESQKNITGENFVQSDIEYFTRLISNNIKDAQKGDGVLCSVPEDKFFILNASSTGITFIKDDECLEFYLSDDAGVGRIKMEDSISATDQYITSSKTNILGLTFVVEDNIETGQPLMTVLVKASPVGDVDNFIYIQNSVSVVENVVEVPESSWVCGDQIYDAECNAYDTVEIGTQCWMAENLAYLPVVHSNSQFSTQGGSSLPGYGVYGYDDSDVPTAKALPNYSTYGVLYNWFAVNQVSICPTGWSVPTDAQLTTLTTTYLGGESVAGGKMKETGTSHWDSPNTGADNTSGFTALPAGYRFTDGSFYSLGGSAFFWSSSVLGSYAWYRVLLYAIAGVDRSNDDRASGYSVRCLKN